MGSTSAPTVLSPSPEKLFAPIQSSTTVAQVVKSASSILAFRPGCPPAESAELLATLAFPSVKTREQAHQDIPATPEQIQHYIQLCHKREIDRIPTQYIIGEWNYHGVMITCRPPVTIPRVVTKHLIDIVVKYANRPVHNGKKQFHVLDAGCGTGAILISTLHAKKEWTGVGLDIDENAVKLSMENVARNNMSDRAEIVSTPMEQFKSGRVFDLMLAAPPSVPVNEMKELPDELFRHQARVALDGGESGAEVLHLFLKNAPRVVKSGGTIFMEIYAPIRATVDAIKVDGVEFVQEYTVVDNTLFSPTTYYYEWKVL